ncbi:MAG: amino acid permease [Gemmatimonadetes bacterium]|nr:amino acid permease [Gemmatimonadota bacterium]
MSQGRRGAAASVAPAGASAAAGEVGRATGSELVRGLGLLDSVFLVMGIIIGSGIFLTTGVMAESLPSPALLMAAWFAGGLLAVAGALTYAELGAAMPEAGGQYIYLREAYGSLSAFLFGWLTFLVYQPGAIAAVATGFAVYLGYFVPALGMENVLATVELAWTSVSFSVGRLVAVAAIVLLTGVNARGLRSGSVVQNIFTALKIAAIAIFVLMGLWAGRGFVSRLASGAEAAEGTSLFSGFGVALIGVLWAYDGFNNLNFSAGEIKEPGRTLPRALILGTAGVMLLYLLVNAVYFLALPVSELRGVVRVAERAASGLLGPAATYFIAAGVLVSTFGSTNGSILTGARVYYAMARDRLFFRAVARVHERYHTPHVSLWLQCLWACLLALSGTFEQIFTYAMFAALLMYGAAATSVFTLRRTRPDLHRPYRVWGYPLIPALYLASIVAIAVNSLIERPLESFGGLGILALGVPVYLYWKRQTPATEEATC